MVPMPTVVQELELGDVEGQVDFGHPALRMWPTGCFASAPVQQPPDPSISSYFAFVWAALDNEFSSPAVWPTALNFVGRYDVGVFVPRASTPNAKRLFVVQLGRM